MKPGIGILLNRAILGKAVAGKKVFERVDLYARAAKNIGLKVILFDPSGVDLKRGRIKGYVPTGFGHFRRACVPMPAVVHKRGLFTKSPRARRIVRRMMKQGVYVFNPPIHLDKWKAYRYLAKDPGLKAYLPETVLFHRLNYRWFRKHLLQKGELFIKPRRGSLGLGIMRVVALKNGRYCLENRGKRVAGSLRRVFSAALRKTARRGPDSYIMQAAIPLANDKGRRYDLRVPVQRGADGKWNVAGMVVKRAGKRPFLTNLARGGKALKPDSVLIRSFGVKNAIAVKKAAQDLAIAVAERLSRLDRRLADLGLDIGLDSAGQPYLIEVNRRDLRITFQQSGQLKAWAKTYHNPIAYAGHLLQHRNR